MGCDTGSESITPRHWAIFGVVGCSCGTGYNLEKAQYRRDTQRHQEWSNVTALTCVIGSEPVPHPCMCDSTCSPKLPVPHPISATLEQPVTQPNPTALGRRRIK
ncbi:hypothetical protein PIB30_085692, partial [Stylosanthes scabra]|nr:hypothetical protein [Stylosanthes scabra]